MANQDQEVKLLGFWVSPFVKRVEWALKLKGVEYEYVEEDIFNKSPQLLELNPVLQKVPVLVHGEKLFESAWMAVCSQGDEKERALKSAIEALEKIEGEHKGKGKKYFGGESIGYLDLALGWISYWLPVCEEVGSVKIVDSARFPSIAAWVSNFVEHPAIKHKLPPRDEMVVYFQWRSKEMASRIASA